MPIRPVRPVASSNPQEAAPPEQSPPLPAPPFDPSTVRARKRPSKPLEPEATRLPEPLPSSSPPAAPPTTHPNRNPDGSHIVGYRKPPVATRFQPEKSGNPNGRPKKARGVKNITVEIFGEKLPYRTSAGEKKLNTPELSLYKLRELVGKGDLRAIIASLDRWQHAVPDEALSTASAAALTQTDQAILELYAADLLSRMDGDRGQDPSAESPPPALPAA